MEGGLRAALALDYDRAREKICSFISNSIAAAAARGAVVGISGGLDSAVVAFLCARALGPNRVVGLFLPERDTAPESAGYAREVAEKAGIRLDIFDLTPALTALGCYRGVVPGALKSRLISRAAAVALRAAGYKNPFELTLAPGESAVLKEAVAFFRLKHRLRMAVLYQRAEKEGMLVAGCLNRTEYLTGFFVRYGDSAADLAPILPLYKTQVRLLAAYLGLPRAIIDRPPTPDLIPGITDELALGVTYEALDQVLVGLSGGLSPEEIAQKIEVSSLLPQKIARLVSLASNLGHDALSPDLGGS